ncbi:MAG: hypothetical protein U0V56_06935 [Actinomycetota bacterium]
MAGRRLLVTTYCLDEHMVEILIAEQPREADEPRRFLVEEVSVLADPPARELSSESLAVAAQVLRDLGGDADPAVHLIRDISRRTALFRRGEDRLTRSHPELRTIASYPIDELVLVASAESFGETTEWAMCIVMRSDGSVAELTSRGSGKGVMVRELDEEAAKRRLGPYLAAARMLQARGKDAL